MTTTETEPRRLTPTERLHDLARAAIERQRMERPYFKVEQVKAVGGATVIEWAVHVPVCDEYANAEAAFAATLDYAGRLSAKYPPPNPNGDAPGRSAKA